MVKIHGRQRYVAETLCGSIHFACTAPWDTPQSLDGALITLGTFLLVTPSLLSFHVQFLPALQVHARRWIGCGRAAWDGISFFSSVNAHDFLVRANVRTLPNARHLQPI